MNKQNLSLEKNREMEKTEKIGRTEKIGKIILERAILIAILIITLLYSFNLVLAQDSESIDQEHISIDAAGVPLEIVLLSNSAVIFIGNSSPLNEGTYSIRIIKSENAPNIPIVQYTTNDNFAQNPVSLTGLITFEDVNLGNFKKLSLMQWMLIIGLLFAVILIIYYFIIIPYREKKHNQAGKKQHNKQNINQYNIMPSTSNTQTQLQTAKINAQANTKINTKINALEEEIFMNKLMHCNTHINRKNYMKSYTLYCDIIKGFYAIKFREEEAKKQAKKLLRHIYLKLIAYRKIHECHKHIDNQNTIALKYACMHLGELSKNIGEGFKKELVYFEETLEKIEEEAFLGYIDVSKEYFIDSLR